jgi:hypothetical protein
MKNKNTKYSRLTALPQELTIIIKMLIPFVHRFLFFLECGGLPPLSKAKPRLRTPKQA